MEFHCLWKVDYLKNKPAVLVVNLHLHTIFFFFNKNTRHIFCSRNRFSGASASCIWVGACAIICTVSNLCKQLAIAISGVTKPLPNINNISNINNVNVTPTPAASSCFPLFFSANDSNCFLQILGFCHQRLSSSLGAYK